MAKNLLAIIATFFTLISSAQSVSEVLSNAIPIKKNEKIFFQKIGSTFQYNIAPTNNFKPYTDSSIFLIHKSGVNIHLQTLNPLRYSYDTTLSLIADPISVDAEKAFASIYSSISTVVPRPGSGALRDSALVVDCPSLNTIVSTIITVTAGLESDLKERIIKTFNLFRDLDFNNKTRVCPKVQQLNTDSLKIYRDHYNTINTHIESIQTNLNRFKCNREDSLILRYVLSQVLKDLKTLYNIKKTRLDNLEKAYKLVQEVCDRVETQTEIIPVWFNDPIFVDAPEGKISILTITINNSGMEVKDGEIVTTEKKAFMKKVLRFRKFQRFIPEASAGISYVGLSFPKYGTSTNSSGQQIVSDAGEEKFKKMNFTAMVNFVYYIENSEVNPFIQIGVGQNTDYPTLMTGVGLRFNTGVRRFSFSVGGASSWIKTLDKLKIGDVVSGTSDIDKDLKHEFKPPKIYFGIQYNF